MAQESSGMKEKVHVKKWFPLYSIIDLRQNESMTGQTISRRFFLAFTLCLLLAPSLVQAQTKAKLAHTEKLFEKEITAFEAADKTNPPPKGAILFVGSSSIRLWTNITADFPKHKVINRGFGGSHISDSIAFADRIVLPYEPKMIVMYAGGNDINYGKTPEQVLADFKTFTSKVHEALPKTKIAYISIALNPARWHEADKVKAANALIKDFCDKNHLTYIDIIPPMLDADGKPRPELFRNDRLHMNLEGYKIWTSIIGHYLD